MNTTYSLWILTSRFCCAHKLRASSLKHEDSRFYLTQSLFEECKVVRHFHLCFVSFGPTQFVCSAISQNRLFDLKFDIIFYYHDSLQQFVGSYASHVLLMDPVNTAILRQLAESLSISYKVSCFYHLETLFVGETIVWQLYLLLYPSD